MTDKTLDADLLAALRDYVEQTTQFINGYRKELPDATWARAAIAKAEGADESDAAVDAASKLSPAALVAAANEARKLHYTYIPGEGEPPEEPNDPETCGEDLQDEAARQKEACDMLEDYSVNHLGDE